MKIVFYSKTGCPLCVKAKEWFADHGIDYFHVNLDDDKERQKLFDFWDVNSVPQFVIDKKRIGGYKELMAMSEEILVATSPGNLLEFSQTYKPFHYPWALEITVEHEQAHWVEGELDLSEDVSDWKGGKLTANEKEYITNILRLFTQSDVAVGQNYYDQFIPKFKNNEVRNMLGSFASREGIHQRAYALLNDTLGLPDSEYHAFLDYSEMADKIDFMQNSDTNTMRGLGLALVKSVFNEGVALFAAFAMLLNFQRFGKMKGMGKVAEWSIRDENFHVQGISKLFRVFCLEHPRIVDEDFKKAIYDMARQAVNLEDRFVKLAYKLGDIEGLSADEMKKYVRFITDRRLLQLGLKTNFKVKENPYPLAGLDTQRG